MGAFKVYNTSTSQWESIPVGIPGYTGSSGAIGYTGSGAPVPADQIATLVAAAQQRIAAAQ